jgi:hypothetical protein
MRRLGLRIAGITVALAIAGSSLGVALPQLVQHVAAAGCQSPSIMFGRWKWCGYFYNRFEDNGTSVRLAGVPGSVNNVQDFINLVEGDYFSGDTQKITEAVFIMRTMTGLPLPSPPCGLGTCKSVSTGPGSTMEEFENRVRAYGSTSENGSQSFGPNGHIDWFHSDFMHCGDFNSYYQNTYHDIAPFVITSSNTPECNNGGIRFDHIFFYNSSGGVIWRIRRLCMNPLGTLGPLAPAPPQWNLTANITPKSGGVALSSGSYVQAGDPITFDFAVNNSMGGTATGIGCQAHANTSAGWRAVPAPETTGPNPPGVTCTGTYGPGNTPLGTETIASSTNDTSVCRSLIISPSTPSGGTSAIESCVYVSSRPYFRVYGGDVSAGNPQSTACATVTKAGIVGWSKDLASFSGAATQYAALAIDKIYDFSTSLGNAAGTATPPSGLAFSNTGAAGDVFGGNFGSLPCMRDYYATATGGAFGGGNISPLSTNSYQATGPISISGNVNPGNRIVLYVKGNVTITGPIKYTGNWDVDHMPLFMLIVSGNIYIDHNVDQMDGIFIAQPDPATGTGGTINTCTNGSTPYTVDATGSFNDPCNDKTLVVNGAFVAKEVQLMRTKGTVKQSNAGEASGSANQAEVFNYNPAVWMPVMPDAPGQAKYDSITSLPPIL